MQKSSIDYSDVQGLVRFAHNGMTEACFFLLTIENLSAARSWLTAAPVTSAAGLDHPPPTALQVAFSSAGLRAMSVPAGIIDGFSAEFIAGMSGDPARSRRLGDVGANAPAGWRWGGPENVPHLLVMLYGEKGRLAEWTESVKGALWNSAFRVLATLSTSNLGGVEQFGFVDGVSQPQIDWDRRRNLEKSDQLKYGNLVALGEFILGFPNEYAKYTDRPLIDPGDGAGTELPRAEDNPDKRDVGRNGTYLVLRQLQQDVRAFWQFMDRQADSDSQHRLELAEAMVGRRKSGEPLIVASGGRIAGVGPNPNDVKLNGFTYESDADGIRCPLGAHVRRANPRNGDMPYGTSGLLSWLVRTLGFGSKHIHDDLIASVRFHRILRRGREYGPPLPVEQAIASARPDEPERGLNFICLNANIERQFEFVQNAWIMSAKFDGLDGESDPLLGNRLPLSGGSLTNMFNLPQENGLRRRVSGLPQFVRMRGGAYFFMPGIRALRYLASFGS